MRNYDVYFEIYGKRMKTRVLAESREAAQQAVSSKIVFHKVVVADEDFNKSMDLMDNFMNVLSGKKSKT